MLGRKGKLIWHYYGMAVNAGNGGRRPAAAGATFASERGICLACRGVVS